MPAKTPVATERAYSATARAWGGRTGRVISADGRIAADLSVPAALGGDGGPGTNPEQLFAAAYSSCFHSALKAVARQEHIDVSRSAVSVTVGITMEGIEAELDVYVEVELPGFDAVEAYRLADAAHALCPYSRAIQGNVRVEVVVVHPE